MRRGSSRPRSPSWPRSAAATCRSTRRTSRRSPTPTSAGSTTASGSAPSACWARASTCSTSSPRPPPADVTMGIHLCKGNSEGRYIAAGSYEPIAARVFPRLDAYDVLLLEYDDERSGGFEPLTETLDGHTVVLGLVSSKNPDDRDGRRGRRADRGGVGVRAHGSPGPVLPVRVRVDRGRQQGHAGDPAREARARGPGRTAHVGRLGEERTWTSGSASWATRAAGTTRGSPRSTASRPWASSTRRCSGAIRSSASG